MLNEETIMVEKAQTVKRFKIISQKTLNN